jgi:hypothetical protein
MEWIVSVEEKISFMVLVTDEGGQRRDTALDYGLSNFFDRSRGIEHIGLDRCSFE